jgi:hypothetical protein
MTCEVGGSVVRSTDVTIGRGETLSVDPCSSATPPVVSGSAGTPGAGTPAAGKAKPHAKQKPKKKLSCTAKARKKHGRARRRALATCKAKQKAAAKHKAAHKRTQG